MRSGAGRPRPLVGELDVQAHRLQRHEQVGEQDRGVEAEPPDRLQRDLRGELGRLAQLEEADARAHLPVLGEVASGLAHQPEGRALGGFAAAGAQEEGLHRAGVYSDVTLST